jgi:4-phosphopantoate--beta-alanine ligase
MQYIPKTHPRYNSLVIREKITLGVKKNITHETGLIAHGRGEAFDYLIGEKTIPSANTAGKIAAATLITAKNPVISVNGNVVALIPKECISLANCISAKIEVNLFHRTETRIKNIIKELKKHGAGKIYGEKGDKNIPGLNHNRGLCDKDGIFYADVVLVALEDGDRCQALRDMGKTIISIDLNPLSRTAKTANITLIDNVIRAIPNIEKWVKKIEKYEEKKLKNIIKSWDNEKMLQETLKFISKRLNSLFLL